MQSTCEATPGARELLPPRLRALAGPVITNLKGACGFAQQLLSLGHHEAVGDLAGRVQALLLSARAAAAWVPGPLEEEVWAMELCALSSRGELLLNELGVVVKRLQSAPAAAASSSSAT